MCTGFIWTPSTGDCVFFDMAEEAYTSYDANDTTGQTIYINKRVQHSKSMKLFYCIEVDIDSFLFSCPPFNLCNMLFINFKLQMHPTTHKVK